MSLQCALVLDVLYERRFLLPNVSRRKGLGSRNIATLRKDRFGALREDLEVYEQGWICVSVSMNQIPPVFLMTGNSSHQRIVDVLEI